MKRILSIIVVLFCFSCRCKEETFYLSENEIALFPYENTSSVTFIDSNQDLIVFDNIMYERDVYEERGTPHRIFAFGPSCDDSYEEINVSMNSGSIYELYLGTSNGFKTTIGDSILGYFQLEKYEYLNNYSFDGVTHSNVLRVFSDYTDSEAILIPNIGVVSIQYGYQEFMPELWQSFTLVN